MFAHLSYNNKIGFKKLKLLQSVEYIMKVTMLGVCENKIVLEVSVGDQPLHNHK